MNSLEFDSYRVLTFDCYGTLIDWESGILGALQPVLRRHSLEIPDETVLELYADLESQIQQGPFLLYKEVLREVVRLMGEVLAFEPLPGEVEVLAESLGDWLPFPDTVPALEALSRRYKLAIISNTDDDLFARTARRLSVQFDWIATAQQVGSYKPSLRNFEFAFEKIRVPRERILHVAQSIYHDIVPAKKLGLSTVWVNRRGARKGSGATPAVNALASQGAPPAMA
ncbi:MAG: haloacid dehalogenase type II, partial [Chitinivibrionia bacterium]|nr:haloacid dehalogenase type II [Chitinivibrionia bacterium]